MKIPTNNLTGPALEWVVHQIEGPQNLWANDEIQFARLLCEINATQDKLDIAPLAAEMDLPASRIEEIFERAHEKWELSKRQSVGHAISAEQLQAIIDRERISVTQFGGAWKASTLYQPAIIGQTHLIAAMRCYVASKLGPEVEVPDMLVPHLVAQRAAAQEATTQHQSIDRPRG